MVFVVCLARGDSIGILRGDKEDRILHRRARLRVEQELGGRSFFSQYRSLCFFSYGVSRCSLVAILLPYLLVVQTSLVADSQCRSSITEKLFHQGMAGRRTIPFGISFAVFF